MKISPGLWRNFAEEAEVLVVVTVLVELLGIGDPSWHWPSSCFRKWTDNMG